MDTQDAKRLAYTAKDVAGNVAGDAGVTASGTRHGSPLHRLGQVGYAAQGLVWILVGWLALAAPRGAGSADDATSGGALQTLVTAPLGRVLLAVMAAGLACYAVWQAVEAAIGHRGRQGRKRVTKRIGSAGKAALGFVLAGSAVALAFGDSDSDDGQAEQEGASLLLSLPLGQALLGAVGLVILGIGGYWIWSGVTAHFEEKLSGAPEAVVRVGRGGYVAKGVAFVVLGGLFLLGAWRHDPGTTGGTDSAFAAMLGFPGGPYVLGAVAVGLIAFGLYQIGAARWLREG